jgi:hypothetical protein
MLTFFSSRVRIFQVGTRCIASTFDIRRDLSPFMEHGCSKEPKQIAEGRSEACKRLLERVRAWMLPEIMDYSVNSDVVT